MVLTAAADAISGNVHFRFASCIAERGKKPANDKKKEFFSQLIARDNVQVIGYGDRQQISIENRRENYSVFREQTITTSTTEKRSTVRSQLFAKHHAR